MRSGLPLPNLSYRQLLTFALILTCLLSLLVATFTTPAFADCGGGIVTEKPPKSKQINIVMDDSGSMFGGADRKAWSRAKYSLEVFAALMNPMDTVNVYLMSNFKDGKISLVPPLVIQGSQSSQARVQQVRDLDLKGGGTPFMPVQTAAEDLESVKAGEKWLVILTDGKFEKISPKQVENKLQNFISRVPKAKIAALAIGNQAQQISENKNSGIYSFKAKSSTELLNRMNDMANLIFQRTAQTLSASGGSYDWPTDIATRDVYLFAQGEGVQINSAKTSTGLVSPDSMVKVKWSQNDPVEYNNENKRDWIAVPEKSLFGVLASFKELPKGEVNFEIPNAEVVQVIFKPNVKFGAIVRDESNKEVSGNLRAGTYTIDYGFLDEKCQIIKSDLLGDVSYSATVTQDGHSPQEDIPPGAKVKIGAGDITIDVKASYLNNLTSEDSITFGVQAAESALILDNQPPTYEASELDKFVSPDKSINANVTIREGEPGNQTERAFTSEEWASFTPNEKQIDKDSGLELQVIKGEQIGQLTIRPRALNEDVFKVKTGELQVPIQLPALNDGSKPGVAPVDMTIKNDISPLARFWNWFKKWLPLLLLIALILGYIFKPRFATRGRLGIKRKPSIEGTPMQIGQQGFNGRGKFEINQVRRFLPFVADTATLAYVPTGVFSFPKLKVKAARQKKIVVLNWKQIAARKNTEINGIPLDETTTSSPTLRASSSIRANDPAMTYDMTLNQ